jgi:hypothetical protein
MEYASQKLRRELVLKINPDQHYPVSYTYNQDRSRNNTKTYLPGKDLTENQIVQLHFQGEI